MTASSLPATLRRRKSCWLRKLHTLPDLQASKQQLQSMRRNALPMERINRSLLMAHEGLTRALVEEREVGKTPSSPDLRLHDAPKAFAGGARVPTMGGEEVPATRLLPVGACRRERMRPVNATAVDDHDHGCAGVAKKRHAGMALWTTPLGIKGGDALREDFRGAIWDGPQHAAPHAPGHPPPGALAYPCLTFEGLLASERTRAQRAYGPARARHFGPPAGVGEGQAPQEGCVRLEQDALVPARLGREGREGARGRREGRRGGRQATGGAREAHRLFFTAPRTLARPHWTPVCWVRTRASARHLHWETRAPC